MNEKPATTKARACREHGNGAVRPVKSANPLRLLDARFKVVDANKQAIAYVYGHADKRDAEIAGSMTLDQARRVAANLAKLPTYLAANPGSESE